MLNTVNHLRKTMRGPWVVSIFFLLLLSVVPFPSVLGVGPSVGNPEGGHRSGDLTVDDIYTVNGTEVYDLVVVKDTGTLRVPSGATLRTR